MKHFDLAVFQTEVICENENTDATVRVETKENEAAVFLTAGKSMPCFVKLRWEFESPEDLKILGDAWERSYTDLGFLPLAENDRAMPWYFLATDGKTHTCFGVKTQPASFVSFRYDTRGLTALLDCRNGGSGVLLGGRTIRLADFVLRRYETGNAFDALCDYCKVLCDAPLLPKEIVYGGNNWYYAYGESSRAQILSDAALQAELAGGIDNTPFMVIDQKPVTDGILSGCQFAVVLTQFLQLFQRPAQSRYFPIAFQEFLLTLFEYILTDSFPADTRIRDLCQLFRISSIQVPL